MRNLSRTELQPRPTLNAEIAQAVLNSAREEDGTVDESVETLLLGVTNGQSRKELVKILGIDRYSDARARIMARAARLGEIL